MEMLDTSVVNVSLRHIAGSLSATVDEATWVLTSYIVASAIILPISGWLASYFGRKRLLMTVVTGFTLSSLLCGIAPTLGWLIFFRVVQGIDRRRPGAAVAGRAARGVPGGGAGQGDGVLGARDDRAPDPRADDRRLADRQLLVALGVLREPARWARSAS